MDANELLVLEPGAWYACAPPITTSSEYIAITRTLECAEAFKVCRELNT
jgi:hypothetical protein